MKTISILKHRKQITNSLDVVELLESDCDFIIRVKYASMKKNTYYTYKDPIKARFEYTKICLFILS